MNGCRLHLVALGVLVALACAGMAQAAEPTAANAPATPMTDSSANPLGLSIHHATLGVADLDKERDFYHSVLGFSVGLFRNRPQFDHQQMHIPGFRLDMICQKGSTRPTPQMDNAKQGWLHIDFSTADPDAVFHRLKDRGINVVPGRMEGDKVASFKVIDPEGNLIEITSG